MNPTDDQFTTETEAKAVMAEVQAAGLSCTDLIIDPSVPPPASAGPDSKYYFCTVGGQAGHNCGLLQQSIADNPTTWLAKLKAELAQ